MREYRLGLYEKSMPNTLSIEEKLRVARRCGYDDPNYFSYVFKRHFGISPTKYRAGVPAEP